MIVATSSSRSRALIVRRETTAWVMLGSLVAVSVVARGVLAHWHTAPRYFPDEYIYVALSRALAHGHLAVRDERANFYGILQPILAAPLWQLFPSWLAYRLVQFENALAASLVVVPLWILGRDLGLRNRAIYLVCGYALAIPMLAMIPVTISDFVAYPLALGGVAMAVRSLKEPTTKRQVLFLVIAFLATLARIQYFVLVPAYLVGAFALDRRAALRRHSIAFVAMVPAVLGAVLAATGYYSVGTGTFSRAMITWIPLEAFILAVIGGVVIVPGAVAAILRPANRAQTAFSWVTAVLTVLTLIEASISGAQEGRFKERYLFALLPLVALAFAVYMQNGRSHRWIVLIVSCALVGAAPQLPFSAYNAQAPLYDAQSLIASWDLKQRVGVSASSAVIAIFITVSALLAILISIRRRAGIFAMPIVIGALLLTTAAAIHVDLQRNSRAYDRDWIDRAVHGAAVTAIATPSSSHFALLKQLYWSASVHREVLLAAAVPTDAYAKDQVKISRSGALDGIRGYFLFDDGGTQATFAGVTEIAVHAPYRLLYARSRPRFRLLIENQAQTGWLAPVARLRAWPSAGQRTQPRVRFTLSLPKDEPGPVHLRLGTQRFVVQPGAHIPFSCSSNQWPVKVIFVARETTLDRFGRRVSVRLTKAQLSPGGPAVKSALRCTRA